MAAVQSLLESFRSTTQHKRTRVGRRANFITVLFGLWLMIGLFVDGWAHNTPDNRIETFFTPWHALFYSGFLATALWISWLIYRELRAGRRGLAAIPQGYHLGLIGVVVFGMGGVGDMLWHTIFGIEVGIDALLSPTHLLLMLGGTLVFASPFMDAWDSSDPAEDAPSFRAFLPVLTSLTLMMSFVSFMNMYMWGLLLNYHSQIFADFMGQQGSANPDRMINFTQRAGLESILVTTIILMAPVLLMLRRWQPPFGAVTFIFTLNSVLMASVIGFSESAGLVIMPIAGLSADVLIRTLRPWGGRRVAIRVVATVIPLVVWGLYFLIASLTANLAWSVELAAGITVMAAFGALGLSLLATPPAMPAHMRA